MKPKHYVITFMVLFLAGGFYACQKAATALPNPVGGPGVLVTQPDGTNVQQGDQAKFDITVTSSTDVKSMVVQMSADNGATWKKITDSTFPSGMLSPQFNYFYIIADSTPVGKKFSFKFTFTNGKGSTDANNSVTTVQSIPQVTITPNNSSVSVGQNVTFSMTALSTAAIAHFSLDSVNGGKIIDSTISVSKKSQGFVKSFNYKASSKGKRIFRFTVTNKTSGSFTRSDTLTVK